MSDPKINTIGLEIFVETGIDLTNATTINIRYTKPDDAVGSFSAAVKIIGDKIGVAYITTATEDIDQIGIWTFEVYAVGNGFELWGNEATQNFIAPMAGVF